MADLLEKASIVITPTGYDVGSINAVKPSTSPFADLTFDRGTSATATRVGGNGFIQTVAQDLPRLDFLGGNNFTIEPPSTNLFLYSEGFNQTSEWTRIGNAVGSINATTAPTGTDIGGQILSDNATSQQGLRETIAVSDAKSYTFSVFAKKSDYDFICLRFLSTNSAFADKEAYFNISTGALGTIDSGITAKIENYQNEWFRCSVTQTSTAAADAQVIIQLASSDNTTNVVGDGSKKTFIYGAQFEENNFATSYIPTSGSTVTRDDETATNSGSTSTINSTEGVLYAEIKSFENQHGADRVISLNDGTNNNRIQIVYLNGQTNKIGFRIVKADSDVGSVLEHTVSDVTEFSKVAARWSSDGFDLFIDGVKRATNATNPNFSANTLTQLDLDNGEAAGKFRGKFKCIAVFKEKISDAALVSLTT